MKLTRASDYALGALVHLARAGEGRPLPSHLIADAHGIPERFLVKVLRPLVNAGILRSVKGPGGGYRLGRSPREVSLLEVVQAVDGPIRGTAPPVAKGAAAAFDRRLQGVCDEAAGLVRERLARASLADLAKTK
jgi:Rrf2 family protein